jgi:hypothetical protein
MAQLPQTEREFNLTAQGVETPRVSKSQQLRSTGSGIIVAQSMVQRVTYAC